MNALRKLEMSYFTLGKLLKLPVGVQIAAVKESDKFKVVEFVLVDEYGKLLGEHDFDFEKMEWVSSKKEDLWIGNL